jgi:hypothetical protein
MAYGERVDLKSTIRGILGGYPLSVGLFRELLQNADDAGATKQVRKLNPNYLMLLYQTLSAHVDLYFGPSPSWKELSPR